jgi:hypothetical protein
MTMPQSLAERLAARLSKLMTDAPARHVLRD